MTKTSRASLFASLEVGKPLKSKEAFFSVFIIRQFKKTEQFIARMN